MSVQVLRRNRREEWILRNRLHPQHAALLQMQMGDAEEVVMGPSGVRRRNPRLRWFTGPNGLRRVDRSPDRQRGLVAVAASKTANSKPVLPLHRIVAPDSYIAVVADLTGGRLSSHDRDVLGLAQEFAQQFNDEMSLQAETVSGTQDTQLDAGCGVVLIAFGELRDESLQENGVDRLLLFNGSEFLGYSPEARLSALSAVEETLAPQFWLFPDSNGGGRDLGLRFAAQSQFTVARNVWQATVADITARGGSGLTDCQRPTPRVILAAEECAMPVVSRRHEALTLDLGTELSLGGAVHIEDRGLMDVDPNEVPLAEAEFILAGGNGIDDWPKFHAAASALGATEGASRVAVDDGFMPRFRQVGATGTWVTARVYFAVGISGAIQHLQGIGSCDKVICINTDKSCAMVKRADLSVIGDADELLAELTELAQKRRAENITGQQPADEHSTVMEVSYAV